MLAVDTHVLVRLITNDDPKQALRAQQALDAELEAGRECMVGHIVVCELMWVLKGLYAYSLAQCQTTLAALLAFPGLRFEAMPVLLTAAKAWQSLGGDFADHLIGAQMQSLGCEAVLTFDKRASKADTHRAV
jgi:predicted nucleic-acid-binding protein